MIADITAVIVTFNRLNKLKTTLSKTLLQPFSRIVIVNNCSTDGTQEWLREQTDSRLEVVNLATNCGGAGGFYEGFKYAITTGMPTKWLVAYDDDSYPAEGTISKFLRLENLASSYVAIASKVVTADGSLCPMNIPCKRLPVHFKDWLNSAYSGGICSSVRNDLPSDAENQEIAYASFVGFFIRGDWIAADHRRLPMKELFIYGDDVFLSLLIGNLGGRLTYFGNLVFIHDIDSLEENSIILRPTWKLYYHTRNFLLLYRQINPLLFPIAISIFVGRRLLHLIFSKEKINRYNGMRLLTLGSWDSICRSFDRQHSTILEISGNVLPNEYPLKNPVQNKTRQNDCHRRALADNDRLALFLPSLAGGGAEKIMLNLASEFIKKGYAVDVVVSKATGVYLSSVPANARIVDLNASRPLTAVPALARYLSAERPRGLLAKITNANLAAVWASQLAGAKTRCVICEESHLSSELQRSSSHNRILMPFLIRHFFTKVHSVVAVSHGVADDLAQVSGIPRESIRVIYNPVVSVNLLAKSQEPTSHPWLQNNGVPVIVGMGRLAVQKDFATLIRAFALVREQIHSRLIILGDGGDRPSLESLCLSLDIAEHVDLPGFVANPYSILSRASLFVLSSRWEGLPGALIEALACGTKVVATDCASGPREILDHGAYGKLCPVGDVSAMAAAMVSVLRDEFVAADPSDWLRQFSLEANSASYLHLLTG